MAKPPPKLRPTRATLAFRGPDRHKSRPNRVFHRLIAIVGTLVYPLAGVLCAFGAAVVLDLPAAEWAQLLVFSVLPPAVLNYMLTEQYAREPAKVASRVLLGNLSDIVVIPVVLAFVL